MASVAAAAAVESREQDDRVAFTKRNWTGRFLRAEVNYGDFQRIMSRISNLGPMAAVMG